jgi:isopenicillin N synthase-like dioxygenase
MNILTVDYQSQSAPKQFAHSLQETGFAILKNHPIAWDKIERVYEEWLAFFHSDAKFHYLMDTVKKEQDGYVPLTIAEKAKDANVKDIKEFYQLYFPWGRYPEEISQLTRELFDELFSLGQELLNWLETYMPEAARKKLSQSLSSMLSLEQSQLRIIHYPALKGDEELDAIRAAAHEDINLITLLPAATEPGLRVKGLSDAWVDVYPDPGALIVNIGDMLQEATDFFYKSTTHRVLNPEGTDKTKERLSMPLFLHPHSSAILSERYTADAYLMERLKELGLKV